VKPSVCLSTAAHFESTGTFEVTISLNKHIVNHLVLKIETAVLNEAQVHTYCCRFSDLVVRIRNYMNTKTLKYYAEEQKAGFFVKFDAFCNGLLF
jgi:hypothetical protein